MKQWEGRVINLTNQDLEELFNEEGKSGWHFATLVGTPFGMKLVMQRETDKEVNEGDELAKKFGI